MIDRCGCASLSFPGWRIALFALEKSKVVWSPFSKCLTQSVPGLLFWPGTSSIWAISCHLGLGGVNPAAYCACQQPLTPRPCIRALMLCVAVIGFIPVCCHGHLVHTKTVLGNHPCGASSCGGLTGGLLARRCSNLKTVLPLLPANRWTFQKF